MQEGVVGVRKEREGRVWNKGGGCERREVGKCEEEGGEWRRMW